jgi:hypothetical protein
MKSKKLFLIYFILILSSLAVTSCSVPLMVNEHLDVKYDQRPKINMHVELKIADNVKNAKCVFNKATYQLGTTLTNSTVEFANNIFEYVTISNNDFSKQPEKEIDAILIAYLVGAEAAIGGGPKNTPVTSIMMRWTLTNKKGEIVWIDWVRGDANSIFGYGGGAGHYVRMSNRRMENAIIEMFLNSQASIYSSEALPKSHFQ